MKAHRKLAISAMSIALTAGVAVADSGGWHGPQGGAHMAPGNDMMGAMMQMHGMMNPGMTRRGIMDGGMMGDIAMMSLLDEDGDGTVTPEEARAALSALLEEHDADGDGTLSIAEFETLHSALIRETMVDRFQHLDADGDGMVTPDEMQAPAERMERMQAPRERMMQNGARPFGMTPGQGPMMDGSSGMMGGSDPGTGPRQGN